MRELTQEPWERSQRRLVVKEADNCVRIGEGWKKTTKALRGKRAMLLRRAGKLKPSAFKSATH